jgi:hypothetical protein
MISLHHSERVHPANSGRVNTSSIPVASASETLSPMGTRAESGSLGRAMHSRYPEQASYSCTASPVRKFRSRGTKTSHDAGKVCWRPVSVVTG